MSNKDTFTIRSAQRVDLDFIGPVYGGMGSVEVPKNAPPMFNVIATDDFLFRGQLGVVESWFKAGRPVEFTSTKMRPRLRARQSEPHQQSLV